MWIDLVRSVLPDAQFASGASAAELTAAEAALGISLPADLVGLLSETDGATDGPRWTTLFWPLHRIVDEHLGHQDPGWPFAAAGGWCDRLCFADSGAGEDFFLDLTTDGPTVCCWNYLDGEATTMAEDLATFLTGWLSGRLTVR